MSKKRCRRKGLVKFFSSVGNGVFGLGGAVQKITPMHRTASVDKQGKVEERFEKTDKMLPVARHEENFDDWEGESGVREVRKRFSPRPAKFSNFQGWGQRISKFFRGLDVDLYRANMRTTPESYAVKIVGGSCLVTVIAITLMVFLNMPGWAVFSGGALVFLFSIFFIRSYPRRRLSARVAELNRMLPYALRHMGTQLSSGIGLPETVTSVSRSDYGVLSEEFGRIIWDMNKGVSFEEALVLLDERVPSEPLRRATRQIRRALRTGGDLSRVLNLLADEASFEMRMKLRDYTQSLNLLTMIYMFVSAVIPAMLMIAMNLSSGGRAGISPQVAGVIYLLLLPFLLFYFILMIKRLEPRL